MRYEPFSEDSEIIGQAMLAMIHCMNAENVKPYLEKYELTQIEPDKWYPARPFNAVLSDMADAGNAMFDFVSIGMKLSELIPDAPGKTFSEKVVAWGEEDLQTNRGSDTGYMEVEALGDQHLKVTHCRPAPDDLLYGFLYGYAKRHLSDEYRFIVEYDEDIPRRDQGGDVTIIHVIWE